MYVERTRPSELDVHQSYKSGQLLLETAKMHGLNEFNFKKICPEGEKGDVPEVRPTLPLADTRAVYFMMKRTITRRFDYSIRLNDFEEVPRHNLANKEMDILHGEQICKISAAMYDMFYPRITQKSTPENQKKTPGNQNETPGNQNETPGNQNETPGNQNETPGNQNEIPGNQQETPGNQQETPGNQKETPGNQKETPGNQENTPAKKDESDFVFLKPKAYECCYCRKVFLHPTTYRRHMIRQLQKIRWCSVCKRGFLSKVWFKKHKLYCYNLL